MDRYQREVTDRQLAKDRDTWPYEMEDTKSAQEIAHDTEERDGFIETGMRSFEKNLVRAFGRRSQTGVGSRLSPDPLIGSCRINRHKPSLASRLPGC